MYISPFFIFFYLLYLLFEEVIIFSVMFEILVRLSVNSFAISLYTELSYLSVINVDNTDNYINYSVCVRYWGCVCVCVRLGVR